jgi:hypothetical protein
MIKAAWPRSFDWNIKRKKKKKPVACVLIPSDRDSMIFADGRRCMRFWNGPIQTAVQASWAFQRNTQFT